ncbi:MAG TPA: protein kinase [Gemmatimonadales bacterium]|nr:protein kinase [Gemmatimonadales bacterium]
MALTPGTKVGPYEVLAQIGAGGMGEVYRARDTRLDRAVAVKVLPAGATSPQALDRFEREAKAIAALNHPNICSVYDVGTTPVPYLVMELLEGESLYERLTRGPLEVASLVDVALALADAIAAAHARGIVHRDLKPSNIVLTPHGPKILDFGLARVVEGTASPGVEATAGPTLPAVAPLTEAGVTVGTVAYMSPEQLRGEALDARTDVFSLGLVLYEMATGQRAFAGGTSAVVSAAILHEHPRAPRTLRPDLPTSLEQAILTALEKDRDTRTQTATELRAELKRIKRELGEAVASADTAPQSSSSNAQVLAGVIGRRRRALAVAAVVALLLVGAAWLLTRQRAAPSIADFELEQLTTSGTARAPAISPRGDYLAYVESAGIADSLMVRQVAPTGRSVPIVPPTPDISLAGVNFTPDGKFVDYLRRISPTAAELWRIPTLSGQPRRLAENVVSGVGWSPDGRQMAYVQAPSPKQTQLVIAEIDGSAPQVKATRIAPLNFYFAGLGGPAWSPDGSTIALVGRDGGSPRTGQIVVVDMATGRERIVATGPPEFAFALAWLDGETLLLSMLDKLSALAQLWTLSDPGGKRTRFTNDTSQYAGLSVTADRNAWVTSRLEASFGVWTSESGGAWRQPVPKTPAKAQTGFGLRWIDDDLLFVPGTGTGLGVARRRASAGAPEMLAPGGGYPSVSRDGSTIVYFDFDKQEQWRMDGGGNNQKRLGRGTGIPSISPDGRQVVVFDVPSATLKSIDPAGIAHDVTKDRVRGRGEVSPDGLLLAFEAFNEQNQPIIAVCDMPACSARQTLGTLGRVWHWMPDGLGLAFVHPVTSNLWVQPIDAGTAKPLRDFPDLPDDGLEIWDFDLTADGRRLAVARARILNDIVLFRRLRPAE